MSVLVGESRKSAVDVCERGLVDALMAGEIRPGTAIPSEAFLAGVYDVNRTTLRVAINRLKQAGLLLVRQGKPTIARDWWRAGPALLPALPMTTAMAEDLLAMRRSLARVVLERLAARPPTAAARAAIDAAVEKLAEAVERVAPLAEIVAYDLEVTRALVRATDRPALALTLNPVLDLLGDLPSLARAMFRDPASNVAGWRVLLAWLDRPDAAGLPAIEEVLAARDAATVKELA
jgi:DNA-binding FadR family transcriptional regulator